MYTLFFVYLLKAHRQISKKWCFEKYCSCDQACQFLTLYGTPWRSYLENLTIDDKFINKRVRLFIHQAMCREEKGISTLQQGCEISVLKINFLKNYRSSYWRCRSSHQRCSVKKCVLKNFANFTGKHLYWSFF